MKVDSPERPSASFAYDDPDFADLAKVETELRRTGEVCHQCRRCLPLCPSFPKLFDLIDATDREIAGVTMAGFDAVNELCYHCKLCYNHCPYTPSTPHEWTSTSRNSCAAINWPALSAMESPSPASSRRKPICSERSRRWRRR